MTAIVVPVPVPSAALPIPDSADLSTWPARMKELHRWMRNDAAPAMSALGEASYQNALHAVAMADSAAGAANFRGAWSSLTGALNMPASVSHSGRLWLLTANLANVTTATPGVSGSWLDVTNFLMGVTTAAAARAALVVSDFTAKNLVINGCGRINQDAYVSGTATVGANQYTVDQWRVVTSGQNLSWTTSGNIRVFTAPAGGVEQVVEGDNIFGGSYVLNWTGTATCTINGSAYTKGATVTLTSGSNVTIRFSGGTFSYPQLEAGAIVTSFEQRAIQHEIALCRRYFVVGRVDFIGYGTTGVNASVNYSFGATMRATPTITTVNATASNCSATVNTTGLTDSGFCIYHAVASLGAVQFVDTFKASARL